MFLVVFVSFLEIVAGDYDCVCSYSVERPVYSQPGTSNSVVGYMYEFDCKEYLRIESKQSWLSIAINHKVGYVFFDNEAQITVCTGQPPSFDKVTTTTTAPSTASTTTTPITAAPTTATILSTGSTSTFQPTDKSTMSQPATEKSSSTFPTTTSTSSSSSAQHTTIPSTVIMNHSTITSTSHINITSSSTHSSSTVTNTDVTTVQSTVSKQPSTESTTIQTVPTTQPTTSMISTTVETSQAQRLCPKNVQQALARDQGILILDAVHRKCFELVEFHTSWFNAFGHCRDLGGKLVTVRSLDQNELLHAHVLRNYMHKTWIGLSDVRSTGQYRWSSGESITYTNWVEGNAQASTSSGSCIVIEPMTGMWQGENCYWSFPYVCEFDIPREMGVIG